MDIQTDAGITHLEGLARINIILGKNGCGKSTLLKRIANTVRSGSEYSTHKYITPERGGMLAYSASIEENLVTNPSWFHNVSERNQFAQFKEQSYSQYQNLEIAVLRKVSKSVETGQEVKNLFSHYIKQINGLLDNIEIRENVGQRGFKIFKKSNNTKINSSDISSGESELIALAIESLSFSYQIHDNERGCLLLDEPDVHLHPDLQSRLMKFLCGLIKEEPGLDVFIATHSTPILAELSRHSEASLLTMGKDQTIHKFQKIDNAFKKILPVFGAHPLTSIFQEKPLLLVEGTDEDRIWQQAARSSNGRIAFYPINVDGIGNMPTYENRSTEIAATVYDDSTIYSLRDRDANKEELSDLGNLVRMKLDCRASENLLLSDEVINDAKIKWEDVKARIDEWITSHQKNGHAKLKFMIKFKDEGYNRKDADLKEVRTIIGSEILQSNTPWEVIVGKALANVDYNKQRSPEGHSITTYMGQKLYDAIRTMTSKIE